MCIRTSEPFPGAAGLALWASDPKLGVAGQQQATGGTLCASVTGARLQQDSDILGLSGGEAVKARPSIKRQKPEPLSSQRLSSGCLRQADIPAASREEVPAHAITRPMRSASKHPRACLRGSDPHGQDQESKELHLFNKANASCALRSGGSEMAKTCRLHPDRRRPITQLSRAALCSVTKACRPAAFPPSQCSGPGKGSWLRKENNKPADTGSFHFMGNSDLLKFLSIPITNKPF